MSQCHPADSGVRALLLFAGTKKLPLKPDRKSENDCDASPSQHVFEEFVHTTRGVRNQDDWRVRCAVRSEIPMAIFLGLVRLEEMRGLTVNISHPDLPHALLDAGEGP